MILTPVTELDAINEIIGSIGEAPINTIDEVSNVDAINATRILKAVTISTLQKGWSFNQTTETTLTPDVFSKTIMWSANYINVIGTDGTIYINNNGNLYDLRNQTDIFEAPIVVNILFLLPFNTLPECFKRYITTRASREFQVKYLSDVSLTEELTRYEMEAWQSVMEFELDVNKFNALQSNAILQLTRR